MTKPAQAPTRRWSAPAPCSVWVRSSTPNVDLQATITEVRPDGKETFVQGGWVRGNERKLDAAKSTPLEPVLSLRAGRRVAAAADRYVEVTIPLYYQGHVYRAGLAHPGHDRAPRTATSRSGRSARPSRAAPRRSRSPARSSMPSSLVLPVVPGVSVPTGLPPCPGLRGEPCRDYQPYANG